MTEYSPNNAPRIAARQLIDIMLENNLTYNQYAQILRLSPNVGKRLIKEWEKAAAFDGLASISWKVANLLKEQGYLKSVTTYEKDGHISKFKKSEIVHDESYSLNNSLALLLKKFKG